MSDRVLEDLAGAVADGEAVDWDIVSDTVRPALLSHFHAVARVRASHETTTSVGRAAVRLRVPWWLALPALLASSHVAVALILAALMPRDSQPIPPLPVVTSMIVFAVAGWTLLAGGRHDRRAFYLGALFLAIAAALAPRFLRLVSLPLPLRIWRSGFVEVFIPLVLWLFVRDFPRLGRFTRYDSVARAAAIASAAAGLVLFAANLLLAAMAWLAQSPLAWLGRNHQPSVYWMLLFVLSLPALPLAAARARMSSGSERRRTALFAFGLFLGSAPMLLEVIVGVAFPRSRGWMMRPGAMAIASYVLYGFLALMPVISAYAVLVQKVLTVRLFVARAIQYALARYTLLAVAILPVAALTVYTVAHRNETVSTLLTSRTAVAAVAVAAVTLLLFRIRQPLIAALDRLFLRSDLRPQDALAAFSASAASAESEGVIAEQLSWHVQRALGVEHVYMLGRPPGRSLFVPLHGVCQPLPRSSALAVLLEHDRAPLDVDPASRRSLFPLLPDADRQWVLDVGACLLHPVATPGDDLRHVLVIGPRRIERPFAADDLLFTASATAAAALALENQAIRSSPERRSHHDLPVASDEELAAECTRCRHVQAWAQAACATCGGSLQRAAVPTTLLGKFTISDVLGRGGMGVVYLATDLVLGRAVAVKTLPRLSGDAARRLRHEARAMALVTHPNLATIFGAETWRDTPFLIVEYLEGGTLARRLARRAMSEAEALELCAILADVVHRIHTAGILHRDIKPSNIGFTGDGTPKLLDFGLARLLGEVTSAASGGGGVPRRVERGRRTDSGTATSLVGTPYYLSPEAIAGRPPDPSFDLWSLGVVFYECLTGRRPFEGADQAALFSAVRQSDRRRLRTSLSTCSSAVADYACAMLDREGNRRPSSAETVARDLRQMLRPGAHLPGVGATSGTRE